MAPEGERAAVPLGQRFPALRRLTLSGARRIPVVQQLTDTECGAACLAMVLGYYGKSVSLEQVREVCGVGRDGTNARDLINGAALLGLRGRGLKVDLDDLPMLPPGATILHWEFSHFVVLAKANKRSVQIVDPAMGRRRVPREELQRAFTGVALIFEPNDLFSSQPRPAVFGAALKKLLRESGVLPRLLVMSMVLQVLGLTSPVLMAQIIDRVLPRGDLDLLTIVMLGLSAMTLFETVGKMLRGYLLSNLRTTLDTRMTLGFLDHLVSLPYSFFQLRSAGDLIMRLNSNSVVREHLTSTTLSGILDGLMVVVYLAILLIGSPPMALAAVVGASLDVLVFLFARRRQRELATQSLQAQAKSQGYEVEMMTAMETLKATGCEHRAVEHWSNIFVDELNVTIQVDRLAILVQGAFNIFRNVGPLAILATGTYQVLQGDLTLGGMMSLSAVAGSFLGPLANLVQTAMSLETLRSYLDRVNDVLHAEPENAGGRGRRAPALSGQVVLDRVSFRYAPSSPLVVENVSLEIKPRQFVAIVGRSGAGKSTMANLILGLYKPCSGRILLDGLDLAELDLLSVRRQIGIVNQNVSLFAASIRDNISLSDGSLTLEQVRKAARRACLHDDIVAMPLGYSTPLGDRGSSLSGGQRQRLALARALVREPSVLLLDEATSSLDAATERKVQESLESLDCTRVVIAHRLSTVRRAHLILVMHEGRLVEQGDHATLLAKGGVYAQLVAAQLEPDARLWETP